MIFLLLYLLERQVLAMEIVMILLKVEEVHLISSIIQFLATTPAPCQYPIKSEFTNTPTAKAFSFGIAREAYSKVFIKENPPMDKAIPGPGQYSIPPLIGTTQRYTLRPKTRNPGIL